MMFPKPKLKKHRRETVTEHTYYAVYNRDLGTCQLCEIKINLELHHICGRGNNLTNNINNCIMLCRTCHKDVVHKNNKKYRPILKEIIERRKINDSTRINR